MDLIRSFSGILLLVSKNSDVHAFCDQVKLENVMFDNNDVSLSYVNRDFDDVLCQYGISAESISL
jgi:hypothetical protein